ncbi:succinate dehydrogenase, cytochrome b556 subunit [Comamonas endophytica]|uniref:Succinate dehydrogenase cytochrome b556 subunit n=1 Tax=Comamonas endophytica TaxID=2949090 RepID=A0ABY6G9J2_9BURK|nr:MULTISPECIES: succinate dehydrogenase, cytochrome b556 subunit [unclassified Acidovorax]MCD2514487.1 succinate dehydrogenase, cytochrome b556 subunit [Acidovorax sp. D4N7]UYG51067.1 succinate dehydrogenase, cytochrome b556 subunit [Acidovorax sp. 5MLIR]
MTELAKKRPEFRNIHLVRDVRTYRMPPAAIVSILHRISGIIMFVLLPFIVWMLDRSISSEISFDAFTAVFRGDYGWFFKLMALALIWSYLHHFIAGLRHLWMDVSHTAVNKGFGRKSAVTVLVLSIALTVVLGAKLFGVY